MKNREVQLDVTIDDSKYRIKKMDPRTACWLFATMASKADGDNIISALGKLTKDDFDLVQGTALRHIYSIDTDDENTFTVPIIGPNGKFVKELEADQVFKLTTNCIMFNIAPFLVESTSTDQPENL